MIALVLHPLVLCAILYLVSRGTAEADFPRVFFLSLGIGLASSLLGLVLGETLGVLTVIPVLAIAVFALMKYCYVTLNQALLTVAVFFGYLVAFQLLAARMLSAS